MRTEATARHPEIEWDEGDQIENHGHIVEYAATGESEDGRKWSGTIELLNGEWDGNVYNIEEDTE